MAETTIVNIAGYEFAPLTDLDQHKAELLETAENLEIKGTIILSQEGINLMLAGPETDIESYTERLRQVPGLENLTVKYSQSERIPFKRFRIKTKGHLIRFPKLQYKLENNEWQGKHLPAKEFKQWLDEGRDITVLDTRNEYEIQFGTFKDAIDPHIRNFVELPEAAEKLPEDVKKKPLVMFCTGGIRCEKAASVFEKMGFENVYQLDGGILKYFEECGGEHYEGNCFVFDERVALTPELTASGLQQCEECQCPIGEANGIEPEIAMGMCVNCQNPL